MTRTSLADAGSAGLTTLGSDCGSEDQANHRGHGDGHSRRDNHLAHAALS